MIEKIQKLAESLWEDETLWKFSSSETKNNKYGICDSKMKVILPAIFDEIKMKPIWEEIIGTIGDISYYFKVKFEDNTTKAEITEIKSPLYVDTKGNIEKDEEIFYGNMFKEMSENLWEMYSNEKKQFGAIDSLGNTVIPFEYDVLSGVTDGQYEFIFAIKDDKYGMFDKEGNVVIPVMYEHLEIFNEDLAAAKLNGKYGFININNELKIPFTYDKVLGIPGCFQNGKALVELNGERFYIDKNGRVLAE